MGCNVCDYKHISDGVCELRMFFGVGYRIYFGKAGEKIFIILCAGDKSTQNKDIERAINYWRKYNEKQGSLDELEEGYLLRNPLEMDNYIRAVFAEYGKDGDSAALLASLRVIAKVKGISAIAKEVGLTRQGLQKSLSARGNPRLDSINSILHSLGFSLSVQRLA